MYKVVKMKSHNTYRSIRIQLQNGKSIQDVCQEYDLTLADLMGMFQHYDHKGRISNKPKSMRYITKVNHRFIIRFDDVHYGTYATLLDARRVRDALIRNGWNKDLLDTICERLGVKRCKK
jgi:hypothetical protein